MINLYKTVSIIWIINAVFVLNGYAVNQLEIIRNGGYKHKYENSSDDAWKAINLICSQEVCKIPCGFKKETKNNKLVDLKVVYVRLFSRNKDEFKLRIDVENLNLMSKNIADNKINVTFSLPDIKCNSLKFEGPVLICEGVTNSFSDKEADLVLWYGFDDCRKKLILKAMKLKSKKGRKPFEILEGRGYYANSDNSSIVTECNKPCKIPCPRQKFEYESLTNLITTKLENNKHEIISQTDSKFQMMFLVDNLNLMSDDISGKGNNVSMSFNTSVIKCDKLLKKGSQLFCNGSLEFGKSKKFIGFIASLTYGLPECRRSFQLGTFRIYYRSPSYLRIILPISIIVTMLIVGFGAAVIIHKKRVAMQKWAQQKDKQQATQNAQYIKLQKKAFLEYQTAVNSFQHLGVLTSLHINDFKYYTMKILNLNFDNHLTDVKVDAELEAIILNANELTQWINAIDSTLTSQTKTKISAILTVVLFKHPHHYIELLKVLISESVKDLIQKNEERLFFRRTGCIAEKLVANWLTLCMYESLQTGEIGRRYFNLCRAIKCKLDTGPVDALTNNSKNCLSFENILLDDINYDNLTVVASVDINVSLSGKEGPKTSINISNFDVNILSLDSISQVKYKILDRALMLYAESLENEDSKTSDAADIPKNIQFPNYSNFLLYFVKDHVKLLLEDIDRTSILLSNDPQIRKINTMSHFNIKNYNHLLVTTEQINILLPTSPVESQYSVHLECPEYLPSFAKSNSYQNLIKQSFTKTSCEPYSELTKEAYLMKLMATKKSIYPFLEGFFQCLLNVRPKLDDATSSISLFDSQMPLTNKDASDSVRLNIEPIKTLQNSYLVPVHFLFNILENTARDLQIDDTKVINAWKINSFILRFWVNLIKNPEFIFGGFDKTVGLNDSLTTVSTVLIESCSTKQNDHIDINSPVIKTLFHEEAKEKFPKWWNSFSERVSCIPEESVIEVMNDINKKFDMDNEYNDSVEQLKMFVKQYCIVHYPSMNDYIKSQNIS